MMESNGEEEVYCTLVLTDSYLPGAQVLAHSLRDGGARRKLAVMVTPAYLSEATMAELQRLYDHVIPVDRITNHSIRNLAIMDRLDLSSAFTKINLWRLTRFSKILYVDADVVALRAPEELFGLSDSFAACPDIGWPDCFNSGVMLLRPDVGTYYGLLNLAQKGISFDGADQGLLNDHFRNWTRLSFVYNVTPSGHYEYTPAYNHYRSSVVMVHFIGPGKPWSIGRDHNATTSSPYGELIGRWWSVWDSHYRPITEPDPMVDMNSLSTHPSVSDMSSAQWQFQPPNPAPTEYDPYFRRRHEKFDHPTAPSPITWRPPEPHVHHNHHQHHQSLGPARSPPVHDQDRIMSDQRAFPGAQVSQHPSRERDPFNGQHKARPNATDRDPPPPIFLPHENVPYVPRELGYDAYPKPQSLSTYTYHQARHQQELGRPGYAGHIVSLNEHDARLQDQTRYPIQDPHTVHRMGEIQQNARILEENRDRVENSLPLRPFDITFDRRKVEETKDTMRVSSPPMQSWNAERFSPPPDSKPEASNWPSKTYENEWDQIVQNTSLFIPPRISSPPSNLHYELPTKAEPLPRPVPIFPWEHRHAPPPSRVFAADDAERSRDTEVDLVTEAEIVETQIEVEPEDGYEDDVVTSEYSDPVVIESWHNYTRSNAWDDVPEIRRYISSLQQPPQRKPGVLPPEISVTPTPFRSIRGHLAGAMDDQVKFPSADGIPDQQHWDPIRQLEALKNAPGELLKRSPPTPPSLERGQETTSSPTLVSSSMPVPEKSFHITAHQRRHESHISSTGAIASPLPKQVTMANEGNNGGPWRPIPRRYSSSATQTDEIITSDASTQSDPEDFEALTEEERVSPL